MKKMWNWYYGSATIRKKLVISYLVLVLLPILVLGMYSYRISRQALIEQTKNTMESNVSSIAYSLDNNIQRENDNIRYLSYNANFRKRLESGIENASALAQELNRTVEPTFWYFITSDQNIKSIEIFSPYVKNSIGSFLKPIDEYEEREWYESNQNDYSTHWRYEDKQIWAVRVLLNESTSSRPIGIMKLDVFSENFISPIYQFRFLNNGIVLLDQDGKTIAARTIDDADLEKTIRNEIEQGREEGIEETGQYIMAVSEALSNGWRIYYYVDKEEISDQINRLMLTTVLVMIICLAVITVLISIISRILSSRILKLKECAEEVSKGNFDVEIDSGSSDEIGIVADSFSEMCQRINQMMKDMYRLGMEKRVEELKALQAMINPHFLYNCLSSIKWKAIVAEQDEIGNVTGLLAKFYRTTLNHGKQITIVKNEIENIKAYLELQGRMHDNNFDVEYRISEDGQELEMPNFLLQPIVENAICHGIEYCDEGVRGYIRIEYYREDDFLVFHICNNGPKLDAEEVANILAKPGKGYGIYNIRERIRMYYNEKCGVFGGLSEDGLVCFTVRLKDKIINNGS